MKLSFVIPAFNEEASIATCIRSIQEELTRCDVDAEIIVVNNASVDRTREIASAMTGVTVVDEPHKGLTQARQAGFVASTGELIANVDADNQLPPGWIPAVLKAFDESPKLAALSGPLDYYDLSPFMRGGIRFCFYALGYAIYRVQRLIFRKGMMLQGGNFIVRRTALEEIGGFNLSFSFYGEDTELGTRLQRVGEVRFSFSLTMRSSARRLKAEGIFTMAAKYGINYIWTTLFHRPFTTTSKAIRNKEGALEDDEAASPGRTRTLGDDQPSN